MSETTDILDQIRLPKFRHITWEEYLSLESKDRDTFYYIKNANMFYLGSEPYGGSIRQVAALPEVADAQSDLHYLVTDGDTAGIYILNAAQDDFECITVTKKIRR